MQYLFLILMGYLLGSISLSYFLGKLKGVEINKMGSKNLGGSNTVVLIGWKAGVLVIIHDVLKAIVAVFLARYLFPDLAYSDVVAGVSCILGHIFPFYLKFKGGKGFASYIGMTIALDWKFSIFVIVLALLLLVITDYIVSGTFTTIAIVPLYFVVIHHNFIAGFIMLIASLVMLYKHKENIQRLLNGTEVGFRSARRGEHRVK